jgi:hypothetical protein
MHRTAKSDWLIPAGIAGIVFLLVPFAMLDEPLWGRVGISVIGLLLLGVAAWSKLNRSAKPTSQGKEQVGRSRIVESAWVARAGIPGVILLLAPFGLPDETLWKRIGMFVLGVLLLGVAVWFSDRSKSEVK